MEHTFFCDRCGKRFDVDEALIGKRARCKDCKHEFVIPGVKNEPLAHDPYGWNDPLAPPAQPDPSPYSILDEEVLPPRLGKPVAVPKRRRRGEDSFAWIKPVTMFGVAVGLMLLLNIAIFAHDQPVVFHVLSILFGLLIFFMLMSGYVISLMIPFFEDTTEGFLCFFVPCYKFYYYMNHREFDCTSPPTAVRPPRSWRALVSPWSISIPGPGRRSTGIRPKPWRTIPSMSAWSSRKSRPTTR